MYASALKSPLPPFTKGGELDFIAGPKNAFLLGQKSESNTAGVSPMVSGWTLIRLRLHLSIITGQISDGGCRGLELTVLEGRTFDGK